MSKKTRIPCEFRDPKLPVFGDGVPLDLSDRPDAAAESVLPQRPAPSGTDGTVGTDRA